VLTPNDVGHRVVIRRLAGVRDGRPQFRDLLGELVAADAQQLTIQTATELVSVPIAEVHRAKRVPPKPARRPPRG